MEETIKMFNDVKQTQVKQQEELEAIKRQKEELQRKKQAESALSKRSKEEDD